MLKLESIKNALKNIKISDVSRMTNLPQSTVWRALNGDESSVSYETVKKLSEYVEIGCPVVPPNTQPNADKVLKENPGMLYIGNNLTVLRGNEFEDNSFDLIYLDPPFNSKRDYFCNFGSEEQEDGFEDTWNYIDHKPATDKEYEKLKGRDDKLFKYLDFIKDGFSKTDLNHYAYLTFMAVRLKELHRVLKPTGSIYLHVDPTESHYLKVIMDLIFGVENFRNEIAWCYTGPSGSKTNFPKKHDVILRYTKTKTFYFNPDIVRIQYKELHTDKGKRGKIFGDNGKLQNDDIRTQYINRGKIPEDFWVDIPSGGHISPKERIGYPTQKPEKLLERIILSSCPPEGKILDPFCGCGTSCAVAAKLGIEFVGIDVTSVARKVINKRFEDAGYLPPKRGAMPYNLEDHLAIAADDKYASQRICCEKLGLLWDGKKGADGGVDGKRLYKVGDQTISVIASVKSGGATVEQVRSLVGAMSQHKADIGVFVMKGEPTFPMKQFALQQGVFNGVYKVQLIKFEDFYNEVPAEIELPEGAYPVNE